MSTDISLSPPPRRPLFGLVDVNNFYVSCERAFNPRLANVPVVVLSNNDGCAVARSNEVKALGIKMGAPWFQMKTLARQHGIVALSSNYALYGDMSNRVMSILRGFSPDIEVYSIDESFLRVETVAHLHGGAGAMGHAMRQRIRQWTSLPVCAGFGGSKTLAKFANHLAKKNPLFDGVCDLAALSAAERQHWMEKYAVSEVWGVGHRLAARLQSIGIRSVFDLASAHHPLIRRSFGVLLERTVAELQCTPCLDLEDLADPKQQIMVSRSFGSMVQDVAQLGEAVAWHIDRAAEKLRAQRSVAAAVYVFLQTNRFRPADPQHNPGMLVPLSDPSDDTRVLTQTALHGLRQIHRCDCWYKKCGVMLLELTLKRQRQETLFDEPVARAPSSQLMTAVDAINRVWGRGTLRTGAAGMSSRSEMHAQHRSPRYTTRWDELPVAR
ncbi:Y-family DNA polymerase [Hydrogenophaga sp.]|uniref:Y-family DNA polymerase n=1 Tax=Hydrogenophaga sp. TaxID=1904254 RepID=UPI001982CD03|nr:Y-family DNA polymerase [Hydrogenophaga sp.]MBD3892774.1 Y-family DNA polymerase [Hydrogenophaga sp.]